VWAKPEKIIKRGEVVYTDLNWPGAKKRKNWGKNTGKQEKKRVLETG